MKQVDIHEAEIQLSRLVEEAEGGEDIIIARAGKPVARLTRIAPMASRRRLGVLDGKFRIPEDFDAPLPDEVIAAFEGRD